MSPQVLLEPRVLGAVAAETHRGQRHDESRSADHATPQMPLPRGFGRVPATGVRLTGSRRDSVGGSVSAYLPPIPEDRRLPVDSDPFDSAIADGRLQGVAIGPPVGGYVALWEQ